jgi:endonuclease/exonuclease/phosphatase (EEP) superfamily protein YafD
MQGLPPRANTDARGVTDGRPNRPGILRRLCAGGSVLIALAALLMLAVHVVASQRMGPLVFTQIFEPYLLLTLGALALALAALARMRVSTLVLGLLVLASAGRYLPSAVSFPHAMPQGAQPIRVLSWNLEAGQVPFDEMVSTIDNARPDVVGLIELVPETSRAAEDDARLEELFPFRVLLPRSGVPGLGLLSRYPILESKFTRDPPLLRAVIAPSEGDPPITVFVAHPFLDGIDVIGLVPDIGTSRRDADISLVRDAIDVDLAAGNDVLVLGDFNVTEREPAYAELTSGLHDAQREAGFGLGLTWRPARLESLPFGLLRIDYLLASAGFVATEAGPDCTPRGSDHCLVKATFARPRIPPASATGTPPG